ncbi:hypothetical protein BDN71DRAFT_1508661 [Pleurotus eryngii]|uniref:F-box domain-containing protein n=1 Tax=Pleurotus eryngii TaxID=5323 RepID=A0A9P5ZTM9_PLEER|nr:hypothetical protein BDN71DRAFT_1508661 [Pleurotus eryngii]
MRAQVSIFRFQLLSVVLYESPEILGQIFEHSSQGDQVRIARVCQTWYNIAVSLIWKRLPDAQVLFHLLAPLLITEDLRVVFSRPLASQDWVRFDSYASTNAAASCPNLRDLLSFYIVAEWLTLDESSGFRSMMSTSLLADSFPSFNNLTIPIPFSRATKVLLQRYHFNKLARFQVASPWMESPDSRIPANQRSCCNNSTANYYRGCCHLAQALPSIKVLSLNPTPDIDEVSTLSVGVISPLFALCPNLYELKLYMNTSDEHIPPPQAMKSLGERRQSRWSKATQHRELICPVSLAIFLGRILPSHCSIGASERVIEAWSEVSRLVPAFRQVRVEWVLDTKSPVPSSSVVLRFCLADYVKLKL